MCVVNNSWFRCKRRDYYSEHSSNKKLAFQKKYIAEIAECLNLENFHLCMGLLLSQNICYRTCGINWRNMRLKTSRWFVIFQHDWRLCTGFRGVQKKSYKNGADIWANSSHAPAHEWIKLAQKFLLLMFYKLLLFNNAFKI